MSVNMIGITFINMATGWHYIWLYALIDKCNTYHIHRHVQTDLPIESDEIDRRIDYCYNQQFLNKFRRRKRKASARFIK
jgi:hypothetical protein